MAALSEPISIKHLIEDAHNLNKEILRLARALDVDLADSSSLDHLINTPHPSCDDKFKKCETLRGLIILRGQVAMELKQANYLDPINPVHEKIYSYLIKTKQPSQFS